MKNRIGSFLLVLCLCTALFSVTASADEIGSYGVDLSSAGYDTRNPYYYVADEYGNYPIQCTWYVWGRAYEKLGIELPWKGNATDWTRNAADAGYPTGTEARANSIMVEHYNPGHVFFVESVEDGYAYVSEGNYLRSYHEDKINLSTMCRLGWSESLQETTFIYLDGITSPSNVKISTDKKAYQSGETITVSVSAENMNWYTLEVLDENGEIIWSNYDYNTTPVSIPPNKLSEGSYTVNAAACNTWENYVCANCRITVSKNDEPTAPTNVRVSTDKETYQPNEDITVSFSAEGDAQWYEVRAFDENEEMVAIGLDLTSSPFTISIEEPGEYRINVIAYRNETLHNFADCYITVSDTSEPQIPTNVRVSTDKKTYQPGETITLSVSADNMNWYVVTIKDENGTYVYENWDQNTSPIQFSLTEGKYDVTVSACNTWECYADGHCSFTVSKNDEPTAPTNVRVSTDKETYQPNEDITVSFSAEGDAQWYEVRAFDENEEMVAIGLDLTSSPFTISIEEPGEYRINVIAYRNETLHNFADCYITVSDTSEPQTPTNARVSTDKKAYQPGETITVSVSAKNMNWYTLEVLDENGEIIWSNYDYNTTPVSIPPNKLSEGSYTVNAAACNTWENYVYANCRITVLSTSELRVPGAEYSFDSAKPSNPRTGDENRIGLWVAFLVVSGAAAVAVLPGLRKNKD